MPSNPFVKAKVRQNVLGDNFSHNALERAKQRCHACDTLKRMIRPFGSRTRLRDERVEQFEQANTRNGAANEIPSVESIADGELL